MSKRWKLDRSDIKKIIIGALIAAAGGVAAYITVDIIPQLAETGTPEALAVAGVLAVAINAGRKLLSGPAK